MLAHHIRLQEQRHSASRVNSFLSGGQQLDFWRSELDGDSAGRRAALGFTEQLLELACGLSPINPNRRMVPSAGARYPIDHLVVTVNAGRPNAYVYSPQQRCLLALRSETAAFLADTHEVAEGQVVIVVVAVQWRTVERYGARGARYCLIEAGYAASSLVEACLELAPNQRPPAVHLCAPEQDVLDGAISIAAISLDGRGPALPILKTARENSNGPPWPSTSPWYSENAIRVGRFYRDARRLVAGEELRMPSVTRSARSGVHWQSERVSCKGFSARTLPDEQRSALEAFLRQLSAAFEANGGHVPLLTVYIREGESFVPSWRNHATQPSGNAAAVADVWAACNSQPVARDARVLLVMAANGDVAALESQALATYYRSLLQIGACSADVYRACALRCLGTTMLCGFDDLELADALGLQGLRPLAIHVFGCPAERVVKTDTTYVAANEAALTTHCQTDV